MTPKKTKDPERDAAAATPNGPENLDTVRDILFGGHMRAVEGRLARMEERINREQAVMRADLEIVGRTDSTGSREVNRALSDERAAAVARALTRLGVPAAALRARGIGTSEPLPATDVAERARLDRSVSFGMRLDPALAQESRQ
jgi:outer membrane protein OmpA-like peptidoglycan-associated protein